MSIQNLSRAIADNTSNDAFALILNVQQWDTLAGYLQPQDVNVGDVLIAQGAQDRSVFFLESGALSVHRVSSKEQMRLAVLTAGAVAAHSRSKRVLGLGVGAAGIGGAEAGVSRSPQRMQKFAPSRFSALQTGQVRAMAKWSNPGNARRLAGAAWGLVVWWRRLRSPPRASSGAPCAWR